MTDETEKREDWPQSWTWGVYRIGDVLKILDLPRRKVLLYIEQGLMTPEMPATGKGQANLFTFADILVIAALRHLEGFGIAPRKLKGFGDEFILRFIVGHTGFHRRNPDQMQMMLDSTDEDPTRIPRGYRSWLEGDSFAVFVLGGDEQGERTIERVPGKIGHMDASAAAAIAAEVPAAIMLNVRLIAEEVGTRISKITGWPLR